MLIDWFTVAAQAVNFLVLIWLLRRFLYGPITRAMAERQRGIDEQMAEAASLRDAADTERARLAAETERIAAERDELTRRLRDELAETRRAELARTRADIAELQTRWRDAIAREQDGFLLELRQRAGQQVVEVARRALSDLADEPLESRVLVRFLDRLRDLDEEQRGLLRAGAAGDANRVHLRSAFEIPPSLADQLTAAVHETLGPELQVRFEVLPSLVGGAELRAGGQAVAWTFDEYLQTLEAAVAEALGSGRQADVVR